MLPTPEKDESNLDNYTFKSEYPLPDKPDEWAYVCIGSIDGQDIYLDLPNPELECEVIV